MPDDASAHGCGWPAALEIPVGADWRVGYYAVTLTAGRRAGRRVPRRAARHRATRAPDPVLVLSTTHVERLQRLGRPVLYTGGTRVSFERPLARGFLDKPEPTRRKMQPEPDREALWYFEWAEPLGLSVWSGGAGWWNWERDFVRWAEANGYELDVAISEDLERHPDVLDGHRLFLSVGHDEYWSWGMREALDALHRRRRQRRDLQRQHVLLAGPLRRRPPLDDLLQVRRRRGPRASAPPTSASLTGAWIDRRIGLARDRARSA